MRRAFHDAGHFVFCHGIDPLSYSWTTVLLTVKPRGRFDGMFFSVGGSDRRSFSEFAHCYLGGPISELIFRIANVGFLRASG